MIKPTKTKKSKIPNALKTTTIRPIDKAGVKSGMNNFRPVVVLPVIEKVLEEVIVNRLRKFVEKFKILKTNMASRKKNSINNKLLKNFATTLKEKLSKNLHHLALFIYFSKAYDTLSHSKLI